MNKPEKLILDYSKWRCGGYGNENSLGIGETQLLNEDGFSCCLGLWSKQLGAKDYELIGRGDPGDVANKIYLFVKEDKPHLNNILSNDCIYINDETSTTPEEKITKLTARLAKEGIQLEVINKP